MVNSSELHWIRFIFIEMWRSLIHASTASVQHNEYAWWWLWAHEKWNHLVSDKLKMYSQFLNNKSVINGRME